MSSIKNLASVCVSGLLLACPGRPSGGDTDSTISGDPTTSPTTDASTTTVGATTDTTDTVEPTTTGDEVGPHEGPWEVVVDALPFPLADVHKLTIGRREYEENFANRGVVEVLFDHEEETITVEIRKYALGDGLDVQTLDRLSLWAFVAPGNPVPHPDPATDCTQDTWKDDCSIYAYYDGQAQPIRTGMDFRVHLPTGYRGQLFVTTEDNLAEDASPRRGDVTVHDLCSSGDITLEAGRANVRMCRDLSPAPECPPDDVQACAVFPDGTGIDAWSPDCPCDPALFGQLLVRSAQPRRQHHHRRPRRRVVERDAAERRDHEAARLQAADVRLRAELPARRRRRVRDHGRVQLPERGRPFGRRLQFHRHQRRLQQGPVRRARSAFRRRGPRRGVARPRESVQRLPVRLTPSSS